MNKNIDDPLARTLRSEALKWWALLTDEERLIYCQSHFGDERHPKTLTGREIEKILVDARD